MNIIKQNPFRILGLTGNAKERDLQRQLGKIKAYTRVGKDVKLDYDFDFIGVLKRNTDEIQEASNKIEQEQKKLLYSLFWFIKNTQFDEIAFNNLKENETEKAIEIWNKTLKEEITKKNYSSYLNLSTLYIALSTIADEIDLQKLQAGISLKGKLIHSESLNDFTNLVTGNSSANDPMDISKKFVDEFLLLLKPFLNKNKSISENTVIGLFNSFPATIQKYVSSKFTEVPISIIENKIETTIDKRHENPQISDEYAEELYQSTKNDIALLKELMGSTNVQFQMIADKLANEILQCSIEYFNKTLENNYDINLDPILNKALKLTEIAYSIAISNLVKDKISENKGILLDFKDKELLRAIDLLKSIKIAYQKNKSDIIAQVKVQEFSLGYGQSINWDKVREIIRNSFDWNKVVDLILTTIPEKNIEIIQNTKDEAKINEFRELVLFVLDLMDSSYKRQVIYLKYWKKKKKKSGKNYWYFPWVIGVVSATIGLLINKELGFLIGAIVGGICGYYLKVYYEK